MFSPVKNILAVSVIAIFVLILSLLIVSFSGQSRKSAVLEGASRRIIDMTGRPVSLPAKPGRVFSTCTAVTGIITRLGESARLAAIDEYGKIVPGTSRIEVAGKGSAISREKIMQIEPDLAFIWWYQEDLGHMLGQLGVPVVKVKSVRLCSLSELYSLVGDALGVSGKSCALCAEIEILLKERRNKAADTARPVVYLELYSRYRTCGNGTYAGDLLEAAGLSNAAQPATGNIIMSAEELIRKDPEIILYVEGFGTAEEIASRPGLACTGAVKRNNIFSLDRFCLTAGSDPCKSIELIREIINKAIKKRERKTACRSTR